jgi:hypothetical protein
MDVPIADEEMDRARTLFAEHSIHEALGAIGTALEHLGTIPRILVVRSLTGLGLREAQEIVNDYEARRDLRHLTARRIACLTWPGRAYDAHARAGDVYRFFESGAMSDRPHLTVRQKGHALAFWNALAPDGSGGSISCARSEPDGSMTSIPMPLSDLRAAFATVLAADLRLRECTTVVQDDEAQLSVSFDFERAEQRAAEERPPRETIG